MVSSCFPLGFVLFSSWFRAVFLLVSWWCAETSVGFCVSDEFLHVLLFWIYTHAHAHTYTYSHTHTHAETHTHTHTHTHKCTNTHTHTLTGGGSSSVRPGIRVSGGKSRPYHQAEMLFASILFGKRLTAHFAAFTRTCTYTYAQAVRHQGSAPPPPPPVEDHINRMMPFISPPPPPLITVLPHDAKWLSPRP